MPIKVEPSLGSNKQSCFALPDTSTLAVSDIATPALLMTLQLYVPLSDFLSDVKCNVPFCPRPGNALSSLYLII